MVPDTLQRLLDDCHRRLAKSRLGELALIDRRMIWAALGPRRQRQGRAVISPGLIRRTHLANLAIQRVLPAWERKLPKDRTPHRLLRMVAGYLRKSVSRPAARRAAEDGWAHAEDVDAELYDAGDYAGQLVSLVCFGASQALSVATDDEWFDPAAPDDGLTNQDLDPEEIDAALCASVVHAGGFPRRQRPVGRERRRQFWAWYLREAVPRAWDQA